MRCALRSPDALNGVGLIPTRHETGGKRHSTGMNLVAGRLRQVFSSGFHRRVQNPVAADYYSEPERDVAVESGTIQDDQDAHPTSAVLIVEVSTPSRRYRDPRRNGRQWR